MQQFSNLTTSLVKVCSYHHLHLYTVPKWEGAQWEGAQWEGAQWEGAQWEGAHTHHTGGKGHGNVNASIM